MLNGGGGDDRLEGQAGNDILNGNDGNDNLEGDVGDDTLNGGAGDDFLNGQFGADVNNGGDGHDIIGYFNSDAAINVNLATNVATGGYAEGDTFSGIEEIHGSNGFDDTCLLYTSPSPRDKRQSRMPSSA